MRMGIETSGGECRVTDIIIRYIMRMGIETAMRAKYGAN